MGDRSKRFWTCSRLPLGRAGTASPVDCALGSKEQLARAVNPVLRGTDQWTLRAFVGRPMPPSHPPTLGARALVAFSVQIGVPDTTTRRLSVATTSNR
jgi:hypothetical protein